MTHWNMRQQGIKAIWGEVQQLLLLRQKHLNEDKEQ